LGIAILVTNRALFKPGWWAGLPSPADRKVGRELSAHGAMSHFLNTLPREPDEQLRVGLQVIELAYSEKSRAAEAEMQSLRAFGKERQTQVSLLERRVGELELQVGQGEQRARELAAENAGVVHEKAALFNEVRQLQERLGKLDQFKR
jgi:hypothetical protein